MCAITRRAVPRAIVQGAEIGLAQLRLGQFAPPGIDRGDLASCGTTVLPSS